MQAISITLTTASQASTSLLLTSYKVPRKYRFSFCISTTPSTSLPGFLLSGLLLCLGGVWDWVRDGLHPSGPVREDCRQHEEEDEGSGDSEVGISFQ